MTVRCLVKDQPQYQPGKAKRSRYDERPLPSISQTKPDDQWRRNHGADSSAAIEDGHPESALANGKPLGHCLGSPGPVACFTQPEDETKNAEAGQTACERVPHRSDGPKHDRTDEASFGAYTVVKLPRESLAYGVCQ